MDQYQSENTRKINELKNKIHHWLTHQLKKYENIRIGNPHVPIKDSNTNQQISNEIYALENIPCQCIYFVGRDSLNIYVISSDDQI